MEERAKFQCHYEDLTFIALYLLVSFKRDKELFKEYSPVYDDEYTASMEAQKKIVEELVITRQLTGEMKLITQMVAADYTKSRNLANRAESCLKKVDLTTVKLTLPVADFGIRQLRDELEAKNDEGIVRELRALSSNLENNKTVLLPLGYTPAISTQFKNLIDGLTTNSSAQNIKKDDRGELTRENIKEMNKLWKMMADVMEDGKKIAKEQKNDAMLKDYTLASIEKKVRLERKKKEDETTPPAKA